MGNLNHAIEEEEKVLQQIDINGAWLVLRMVYPPLVT